MKSIRQFIDEVFDFFLQIYLNRRLIKTLSLRNMEKKYVRNIFGFVWVILEPLAFVIIMYFVFSARYANRDQHQSIPFIVYLLTGQVAFEFFSSSLSNITLSIQEHSYLLKKVNFRVAILPLVTLLSNMMVHLIILCLASVVIMSKGIYPSFYWIQIFYYLFSMSVFLIALGWFTSSVFLFFADISNITQIITRVVFFLTPIFWKMEGLPTASQHVLKLNPVYYFLNGYRDSMIFKKGFWEHPLLTLYFWTLCLVMMIIGVFVFKKLRPHFADVVD